MRALSFGYAVLAAATICAAAVWAIDTEGSRATSDIATAGGQRFAATAPSAYGPLSDCVVCHKLDRAGPDRSAPSLIGVVGAAKARSGWFAYSPALRAKGGEWTAEELDRYLENPASHVPGTFKTLSPVRDANKRKEIVEALAKRV